jgi:hypothetical protein
VSEQLVDALLPLALVWCLIGLWLLTVAYVFWDARRRRWPDREVARWMLIATIPFIGFILYLRARRGQGQGSERVTLVRGYEDAEDEGDTMGTIPAEFWRSPDQSPTPFSLLLVGLEGPYAGSQFEVDQFPARVGRTAQCRVCLQEDLAVSRRHAELYQVGDELRLRDMDSTHGTYLNGQPVRDEPLIDGDTLQVGNSIFVVNERRRNT